MPTHNPVKYVMDHVFDGPEKREEFTLTRCENHPDHFYISAPDSPVAISYISGRLAEMIDEQPALRMKHLKTLEGE